MAAAIAMASAAACAEGVEPSSRAQQTDAGGRGGSAGSSGTSNAGSGGSSFGGSGAVTTGGSGGVATGGSGGVATGGVGGVGGSGGNGTGGASGGSGGATGSGGSATGGTGTSGGSGGTGGVSGTGGTTATDGASGTGGSTGNCPAASPEAGTGVVTLQLKNNEDTGPSPWSNADIRPTLNIINTSGGAIDLTTITIRYWFTPEGTGTLVVACYNACNGITTTFVDVSPARTGATKYLEVGFSSGTLSAGASITDLKLHIHTSSYENQDETNDYSYCTLPNYINWDRVTVYQNSALIWGIEP